MKALIETTRQRPERVFLVGLELKSGAPGELSLEGETGTAPDFSRRMDQVRGELLKALQKRGLDYVSDVYFTSFLVQ